MYFRKVSQICISRNTSVSQGFANVISHAFASFAQIRKYGFAVFRKLLQFMVSQAFARIHKDSQMDFRRDLPRIRKCKNHGFSQGLAMGSLLMNSECNLASVTWHDTKSQSGYLAKVWKVEMCCITYFLIYNIHIVT